MPYEVKQLLPYLQPPVTARPEDSLRDALATMLEHDFSQLPVIQISTGAPKFFLITARSIPSALQGFQLPPSAEGLQVRDAMVKVTRVFLAHDDLFELFGGIAEQGAALIVDENFELLHICTSYDATLYFRRWSEDLMQARDVENLLKRLITMVFRRPDGSVDEEARQEAIDELTPSNKSLKRRFRNAVSAYLKLQQESGVVLNDEWLNAALVAFLTTGPAGESLGESTNENAENGGVVGEVTMSIGIKERLRAAISAYLVRQALEVSVQDIWIDEAFEEIHANEKGRAFKDLTLDTYIKLFLRDESWARYGHVFGISREAVATRLEGVRDTRNKLAHFREDEVTTEQRQQLKSCADWLDRYESEIGQVLKPVKIAVDQAGGNAVET